MDYTFVFIALKYKTVKSKVKTHQGQKELHYTSNTTLAICKHVYKQHANTKLAKNPG